MPLRLSAFIDDGVLRFILRPGLFYLGAAPTNEIHLPQPTVSGRHARLRVEDDCVWLTDLESTNGTFVGARKIEGEIRVEPGERWVVGGVVATLELVDAEDLEAAIMLPSPDRDGTELEAPSPEESVSGRFTLAGTLLQEFSFRMLPTFLDLLRARRGPVAVAQEIGSSVMVSFPCIELEIGKNGTAGESLWFRASGSSGAATAVGRCSVAVDEVFLRAVIVPESLVQGIEPLFETVGKLLSIAAGLDPRDPAASGIRNPGQGLGADRVSTLQSARSVSVEPASVDPQMKRILSRARRVAASEITVLIQGESGTGKEVMADFIHRSSKRSDQRMVALNCAALPRDLLEVELFGIEKGVATGVDARPGKFEQADGGTLFLDEIGDMAADTQAKILRVLQAGEVYRLGGHQAKPALARVIAATNRDLPKMVEAGEFRRDLFYRLAGWVVTLPALRDRPGDIPNLAAHFLTDICRRREVTLPGISVAAMDVLCLHDWPGNIRELRHEIERASIFAEEGELLDSHCFELADGFPRPEGLSLKERLEWFEKWTLERTLAKCDGDTYRLAELLGLSRSSVYRRMHAYGLAGESVPDDVIG